MTTMIMKNLGLAYKLSSVWHLCCDRLSTAAAAALAFISGLILVCSSPTAFGSQEYPGLSFQYSRKNGQSGRVYLDSNVLLGDSRLLVTQENSPENLAFIADFNDSKVWFVDHARRLIHLVPGADSTITDQQRTSSDPIAESNLVSLDAGPRQGQPDFSHPQDNRLPIDIGHLNTWERDYLLNVYPGLPRDTACQDLAGKPVGLRRLGQRLVEAWQCMDGHNQFTRLDLYDNSLGWVVAAVDTQGVVEQWKNFRAVNVGIDEFRPPDGYSLVDVQEFFSGNLQLGNYEELDDSVQGSRRR